jgi:hypothetical protein
MIENFPRLSPANRPFRHEGSPFSRAFFRVSEELLERKDLERGLSHRSVDFARVCP